MKFGSDIFVSAARVSKVGLLRLTKEVGGNQADQIFAANKEKLFLEIMIYLCSFLFTNFLKHLD